VSGLSAVEEFPATADNVTLLPNPSLVDRNTIASAGIDVGYGPSLIGDLNGRDVGVQLPDAVTPVNTIYVWFDRPITREVGAALAGAVSAYQSDDNRRWTPVYIARPPVLSAVESRLEIGIAQVQAQFLKVVLRPLGPGITPDAIYRAVFVTELECFFLAPVRARETGSPSRT
jgi:hypothetical protein